MIEQVLTGAIWFFGIAITALVAFLIYDESKYKHKAIILENNKGTELINLIKVKERKHQDGSIWWKLKKYKDEIPRPPNQALNIDNKGRFICKFYALDGGELKPLVEKYDFKDFGDTFIQQAKPVTVQQRQMIADQIFKANREKGKSLAEILMYAVPFATLIIIIAMVLIFSDEALQPAIQLGETNKEAVAQLTVLVEKMDAVINNRVYVDAETPSGGGTTKPNVAPN